MPTDSEREVLLLCAKPLLAQLGKETKSLNAIHYTI